jgi:predicted ATPase
MIKSVTIENFLSFGQAEAITLNPEVNVLLGINGTGKSNFIKAVKLLREAIAGDGLSSLVSGWGGFGEIVNFFNLDTDTIKLSFQFDREIIRRVLNNGGHHFPSDPIYELTLHKEGIAGGYYLSERFYDNGRRQGDNQFIYLDIQRGRGIISTRNTGGGIQLSQAVFKAHEPVLRQISEPDRFFPHFTLKQAIENIIVYEHFDTAEKSPLRGLCPFYDEGYLLPDGRNLGQLFSVIEQSNAAAYDQLTEIFRTTVNPNFRELRLSVPVSGQTLLSLREENLRRPIPISKISDGTLRFLLYLSIFYNPNRGKVICIDEPEIGLHPDMINAIGSGIIHAAQDGSQLFVATHSPLLLNSFVLEDLLIFEKNAANQTTISRKSEDDFENWEGDFLAGQMWLQGILGGVRW